MILWDIESGERLRTFDCHDRGLACIDFKVIFVSACAMSHKIINWFAGQPHRIRFE